MPMFIMCLGEFFMSFNLYQVIPKLFKWILLIYFIFIYVQLNHYFFIYLKNYNLKQTIKLNEADLGNFRKVFQIFDKIEMELLVKT